MHVPWVVGFRGKMIEHVTVEGCTVVVDEGNGAFWKRRDARLKAKSAAKKRRVLEKELQWRLFHVDDKGRGPQTAGPPPVAGRRDSDSDDEHEAYMESAAADWDAAESPGKQSYAERLQAARERVKARVAARVQARAEDQARQGAAGGPGRRTRRSGSAFDDELIHMGRWRSSGAPSRLRGGRCASTTPCASPRIVAPCGISKSSSWKRVMTAALADSVQHKREKVREDQGAALLMLEHRRTRRARPCARRFSGQAAIVNFDSAHTPAGLAKTREGRNPSRSFRATGASTGFRRRRGTCRTSRRTRRRRARPDASIIAARCRCCL